ncbi:MAG: dihydrolipoyl dehydrogenase [bacterium]
MYDIAIIGAGPGGYVAAIKAAQLGAKVALVEREYMGGTCLNWGCIPTKAVLASVDRFVEAKKLAKFGITAENISIDYQKVSERKTATVEKIRKSLTQLVNSYNIDIIEGTASIKDTHHLVVKNNENITEIEFKNLIIATGSTPVSLPGLTVDHKFIFDTNDILSLDKLPESVLIVGSGASGIEWARIFSNMGKKVTVVEVGSKLAPMLDNSCSERVERLFKRSKIDYYYSTHVEKIEDKKVILANHKLIEPEIIFLAAGRAPVVNIEGLKETGLDFNGKFIDVDNNMRTNIDNIYAIGDVTGKLLLAHVASHHAIIAVEHIMQGKEGHFDYDSVPKIVYGTPEICSVGLTEEEIKAKSIPYLSNTFMIGGVGKSVIEDEIDGFIKVLATKDKILGVHLVAKNGDFLIQQAAIAMNNGLSPDQLKHTVFAHPTVSEALHEAFLGIDGLPIHVQNPKK